MHVYVITGASRGLGAALAQQLLQPGNRLYCVSRSRHVSIEQEAAAKGAEAFTHTFDLSSVNEIDPLMQGIIEGLPQEQLSSLTLINNAGMIDPIVPAARMSNDAMKQNIEVNLVAPILLSTSFLRLTETISCEKRIVNISSGAGKNPYFGWSHYCTSKAGLDMFTKTVALEQLEDERFKAVSIAPGVVDTQMQETIRSRNESDFIHVERFRKLKEEGKLLSPEESASFIIRIMKEDSYPSGAILDVRDLV